MGCETVREELPLLTRGEIGSDRERELQEHLATCESCRAELSEVESLLTLVGAAGVPAPGSQLRDSVLGTVEAANLSSLLDLAVQAPPAKVKESVMAAAQQAAEAAAPDDAPGAPVATVSALSGRRRRVAQALAAAAILIAGVVLGSTLLGDGGGDMPDAALNLPEGHETQVLGLEGMGPSDATVRHYRHDNFRVTLSVAGYEVTPAGFHYAVWVRGAQGDVAVGTFRLKGEDDFDIPFAVGVNPAEYPEFVVTLEPNDGDPALTGAVVTEGSFDPDRVQHGQYDD